MILTRDWEDGWKFEHLYKLDVSDLKKGYNPLISDVDCQQSDKTSSILMALEYIEEAKRATVSLPIPQNQLHAYKK
jgi:hypothetical protein